MKVTFAGAAQTVTGSAHLITLDSGYRILLDCGLYQGNDPDFDEFNEGFEFDPKEIDVLVLSHAHIDHSGRIPKLFKEGFEGRVICTHATRDLCAIMLTDSAFIQERDAHFMNKRRKKGQKRIEPLYDIGDVQKSLENFVSIGYNKWFKLNAECEVIFRDSGHILGSGSVTLKVEVDGGHHTKYIGFTGDIGRPERLILKNPQQMNECDYIICESTYGGKLHSSAPEDQETLLEIINEACIENRGKLIIPAFSVGRTQEIVYMMDRLETSGKLPKLKVFVDSPLAVNATEIFQMHPDCFDKDTLDYMHKDPNPFGFNNLHYVRSVDQSKAINNLKEPCIIISASGMMQAGRVKHHIFNNIENPRNTLLIVGFCAPNTLGGILRTKPEKVKIFGEQKNVNFNIRIMDSFSAHGDQKEMIEFLDNQDRNKLKRLFLVHGEPKRQEIFKKALLKTGIKDVQIPHLGQVYNL